MKLFYEFLFVLKCVVLLITVFRLFKKDLFCAGIYLFLSYFSIAFDAGYLFKPQNILSNRYVIFGLFSFNSDGWLECYLFTFSSLIIYYFYTTYLLTTHRHRLVLAEGTSTKFELTLKVLGSIFILAFTLIDTFFFINIYNTISYQNSLYITETGYSLPVTIILTTSYYVCAIFGLAIWGKDFDKTTRLIAFFAGGVTVVILILYALKSGDKSTLAIPLLGVVFGGLYKYRKKLSFKFILCVLLLFILTYLLIVIVSDRVRGNVGVDSVFSLLFPEAFQQNIFSMFAVIKLNYVNPLETIIADFLHIFTRVDHPYLFETVTNLYSTFSVSDTFSFGHYLFVDGYVFAGPFGAVFNGIVIGYLTFVWSGFSKTNSEDVNVLMVILTCSLSLTLVRGGSGVSAFIKYIYIYIIPTLFLYVFLTGKKLNICYYK